MQTAANEDSNRAETCLLQHSNNKNFLIHQQYPTVYAQ